VIEWDFERQLKQAQLWFNSQKKAMMQYVYQI